MAGIEKVYIALLHYPVYNKRHEKVASAVTSVDIHDLGRLAKTYGVGGVYFVTPLIHQRRFIGKVLKHWFAGGGREYNPDRRTALSTIFVAPDLDSVRARVARQTGAFPKMIMTTARQQQDRGRVVAFQALAEKIREKNAAPIVLLLGTGWGICDEIREMVDFVLEPIQGQSAYNHLSVRSAAAIMIDRLTELSLTF